MTDDDGAEVAPKRDKRELKLPGPIDPELAEQLVEQARTVGVDLIGPGGPLGELTKQVLETGLEVEMDEHLGYDKHAPEGRNGGNSRNGTRSKTVITEVGPVEIDTPRDRDGTFDPKTVRKRQRRLGGVDSMVISLTAKGLTTGEVQAHLAETYGTEVSRETISKITDRVLDYIAEWQNRPLDRVYPVVFIDAIVVKIRDGQVTNRPVYCAIGVTVDSKRDILGLWVGTGSEGAKYWLQVLTEIKNRGTDDVCIVVCDGLKGLPDAIETTWPRAVIIGLDPHKASNTIAVLGLDEAVLVDRRFAQSETGLSEMLEAVARFEERVWAVEGANGLGRTVAQHLVSAGEMVFDVPAKLATRVRVYSTGHGTKNDSHDAVSIARAALHSRQLRRVVADDENVALRLLSDRREELVAARTQAVCRLHRLLRELIPGGTPRELTAERASDLVSGLAERTTDPAGVMRLEIAQDHLHDIRRLDLRIDQLTARIRRMVTASETTLIRIFGISYIGAAIIMGEVGNIGRFPTRNHLASYAGAAPIEVSSGEVRRHRLSRSGNRKLNRVLHTAALVQIRYDTPGRSYYQRKLAEGKNAREAMRCLKRRIIDAVWQQLQTDRQDDTTQDEAWPRWRSTRGDWPTYRSPDTLRRNGRPKKQARVKV